MAERPIADFPFLSLTLAHHFIERILQAEAN